jgi:hypothetical protein
MRNILKKNTFAMPGAQGPLLFSSISLQQIDQGWINKPLISTNPDPSCRGQILEDDYDPWSNQHWSHWSLSGAQKIRRTQALGKMYSCSLGCDDGVSKENYSTKVYAVMIP